MRVFLNRITAVLNSRRFFWVILALFIFEASWIALSAAYPQAFDEDFHFGLIQIYSHYWLPFLKSQPVGADQYGAVYRDPSFLYHYVMSFPYRLIANFVHYKDTQVIILRLINIAFAAIGLILFKRALLRARVSRALTNLILLLFILVPIAPQLAGQINYDNLLFPLVAWSCLLAMQATDEIIKKRLSIRTLLTLMVVCTLSSLVKYEFLPIYVGIVIYLVYQVISQFHGKWKLFFSRLLKSWIQLSHITQFILVAVVIISLGLFAQRDGYNIVKYHNVAPDCSVVLGVQPCNAYSAWNANYYRHKDVIRLKGTYHFDNLIQYTGLWAYWLWYRMFFAVDGPTDKFRNWPPLPLPAAAAAIIGISSIGILAFWGRRALKNNPHLILFAVIVATYFIALWIDGYYEYRYTNTLVLMNGRYVLPILLPTAAVIGVALAKGLRHRPTLRASLACVAILLFVEGGGLLTFIMRSDSLWDWNNSSVVHVNNAARDVFRPVIIQGSRSYSTKFWVFN